jgi:hypothetical protein
MRIDVALSHRDIDGELATLHDRMRCPGDRLHGMPVIATTLPGLVFRYREADGEFYVYVEDTSKNLLAGSTVFNRVLDIDRRADRYLRSPHSRYASKYCRRGIGSAVYRWALDAGMCLITGPRQSIGAHRLWLSLARSHELLFVQLRHRKLHYFGPHVDSARFQEFDTRMVLLGTGWSPERFSLQSGARHVQPFVERR